MTTKVLLSWLWWLWWLWFLLLGPVERAEHRSLSRGVSRDRDRARAAFCAAGELVSRPDEARAKRGCRKRPVDVCAAERVRQGWRTPVSSEAGWRSAETAGYRFVF